MYYVLPNDALLRSINLDWIKLIFDLSHENGKSVANNYFSF